MKISFCKGQLVHSGEILRDYALALKDAGHDVSVIAVYPHRTSDQVCASLLRAGIAIETFEARAASRLGPLRRIATAVLSVAPFLRPFIARKAVDNAYAAARDYEARRESYFRETKPDVVYVNSPDPAAAILIELAHAAGSRVVYHELLTPSVHIRLDREYENFVACALPKCDAVAALTPAAADECRCEWSREVLVLPVAGEDTRAVLQTFENLKG